MSPKPPFLSALMIVKDEEENIPACLGSLAGLVDEVVVYDTGSTDGTIEVIRRRASELGLPLTLVEGYWDDDFARARNASLDHCTGEWVLWIDADETIVCDHVGRLRAALLLASGSATPLDRVAPLQVAIDNLTSGARSSDSFAVEGYGARIFPREAYHWVGALHEQLRSRPDSQWVEPNFIDLIRIVHAGYSPEAMAARHKAARNLRIARRAAKDLRQPECPASTLISLARALRLAGEPAEAWETFRKAVEMPGLLSHEEQFALGVLIELSLELGSPEEAERFLGRLRRISDIPRLADFLEATIEARYADREASTNPLATMHRWERCVELLSPLESASLDHANNVYKPGRISGLLAHAQASLGSPEKAAATLLAAVEEAPDSTVLDQLPFLLDCLDRCGQSAAEMATAAPPWLVGPMVDALSTSSPAKEGLVAALRERWPDDPRFRPLLSACIIVKDEEENIPACLGSLAGLVDEVVVYDTGSTDGTIEVTRRHAGELGLPLTLVEGYWDDDFARARNASLDHCTGEWVLWIDADETAVFDDPEMIRGPLTASANPLTGGMMDGLTITIQSESVIATASVERGIATRLFRRRRCYWVGRLHEQVRRRSDNEPLRGQYTDLIYLRHNGYLPTVMIGRNKSERNLRIAEAAAAADDGAGPTHTLVNLGRTRARNGHFDEALQAYEEGVSHPGASLVTKRMAFEGMVRIEVDRGNWDEARRHLARLWKVSDLPALPQYFDALISARQAYQEEDAGNPAARTLWESAIERCNAMPLQPVDDQGCEYGPDYQSSIASNALAVLGRFEDACQWLLDALEQGFLRVRLDDFLSWSESAGRDPTEIWQTIPPWLVKPVLAQAATMHPSIADRILEGIWGRWPDDENVVAFAAVALAPHLPTDRGDTWSARLARVQELLRAS